MAEPRYSKVIALKVDPELDEFLTSAAGERGMSKAALIRGTLLEVKRSCAGRSER